MDIWDAMVLPYDMGDEYAEFFSKFLEVRCKLAYVNTNRPRYILGSLPSISCQKGQHPRTGLSDGAPYLYISNLKLGWPNAGYVQRRAWRTSMREWKSNYLSFALDRISSCKVANPSMKTIGQRFQLERRANSGFWVGRQGIFMRSYADYFKVSASECECRYRGER